MSESPATPTVTLLNIAPRDGRWPNGAPFCYFWHGVHLVVCTLDPRTLSLVRKYLGVHDVWTTDIRRVLETAAGAWADFTPDEVSFIVDSQFRSLWYLTLLAKWIVDKRAVPADLTPVPDIEDDAVAVGVVDNFGNCKLTCQPAEIGFAPNTFLKVLNHKDGVVTEVRCLRRLSDVPPGEAALIIGSSGSDLIELVVAGGSAAARFGLTEGVPVFA